MKNFLFFLATAMLVTACSSGDGTFVRPTDPMIAYSGRIDMSDSTALAFTYPGVSAEIIFDAPSVMLATSPRAGSFMVEVDDNKPFKLALSHGDSLITLAENLPAGEHRVKVIYAMEGHEAHPKFRGFYFPEGGHLIRCPEKGALKIEFIGNSITCGYGLDTDNPEEHFSYQTENHYHSYVAQVARSLDADYNIVARSGIGIYRNYGGPRSGTGMTMSDVYDRTLYDHSEPKWDFSRFIPDIVCVNLGTNDTSFDNYDTVRLTDAYRSFTGRLRSYYPEARIVLLTGSMLHGQALKDVRRTLDTIAQEAHDSGDSLIYRFDMTPQDGTFGYGADYHPSCSQANLMASELTEFLKTLTM